VGTERPTLRLDGCMGIFRRGGGEVPSGDAAEAAQKRAAIQAFWRWWTQAGSAEAAAGIHDHKPERVIEPLSRHVHDIDPGLMWQLRDGDTSEHLLVVGAGAVPGLRAVARRWLMAAPPADSVWSYTDLRPPVADLASVRLDVEGTSLALEDMLTSARREGARLHLSVFHPAFPDLPERARVDLALLSLDAVLGEGDVEMWIGKLEAATFTPLDPVPLVALRAAVRDLRQDFTDPDGKPRWVVMEGMGHGGPILASAQVPLSCLTAPQLDRHVTVELPYADRTEQGFPGQGSLPALTDFERRLAEDLRGTGQLVAHESHNGVRVLHLYVDSTTDATEQLRAAAARWSQGSATVRHSADPAWQRVAHLRM
jgi:hypothetical protein